MVFLVLQTGHCSHISARVPLEGSFLREEKKKKNQLQFMMLLRTRGKTCN